MDKQKFNAQFNTLNKKRKSLQGSLNYWNNAIRACKQNAEKWQGSRRNEALKKLAYCEQRATEAQTALDAIKHQLTKLDPSGAIARQIQSVRTNIAHTKRDIKHIENTLARATEAQDEKAADYYRSRLQNRQDKLARLQNQIEQLRPKPPAAQPTADTLAILERLKQPIEEAEASFAKQHSAMQNTSPLDAQTNLRVIHGLQLHIIQAELSGNPKLADELQNAYKHLIYMLDDSASQTVLDGLTSAIVSATQNNQIELHERLTNLIDSIETMLDGNEPDTLH